MPRGTKSVLNGLSRVLRPTFGVALSFARVWWSHRVLPSFPRSFNRFPLFYLVICFSNCFNQFWLKFYGHFLVVLTYLTSCSRNFSHWAKECCFSLVHTSICRAVLRRYQLGDDLPSVENGFWAWRPLVPRAVALRRPWPWPPQVLWRHSDPGISLIKKSYLAPFCQSE